MNWVTILFVCALLCDWNDAEATTRKNYNGCELINE